MRKREEVPVCKLRMWMFIVHMWHGHNIGLDQLRRLTAEYLLNITIKLKLNVFIFPQETVEWFQSVRSSRDKENVSYTTPAYRMMMITCQKSHTGLHCSAPLQKFIESLSVSTSTSLHPPHEGM